MPACFTNGAVHRSERDFSPSLLSGGTGCTRQRPVRNPIRDFRRASSGRGPRTSRELLAIPTALNLLNSVGVDSLRERNAALVNAGAAMVAKAINREPPAPSPIAMVTLELPSRLSTDAAGCRALRARVATELRAEVVIGLARGRTVLRLSAQAYNREDDYQQLAGYLASLP